MKAVRIDEASERALEGAQATPKGVGLDLKLYVYCGGDGFAHFPGGNVRLNSPEQAMVWFAQTWERLSHQAAENAPADWKRRVR